MERLLLIFAAWVSKLYPPLAQSQDFEPVVLAVFGFSLIIAAAVVRRLPAPRAKRSIDISPDLTGTLQLALLAVSVGLLYYRILAGLLGQWLHDPNYSHGFFVPLFSAWVMWKQRKRLADEPVRTSDIGLLFIVAALAELLLGVIGAENFLSRTSLLLLVAGLTVYFRGWRFFRAMLFPWGALFLMIPLPTILFNQIALPLQFEASRLAAGMLALVGVPVLREGNLIHLPSFTVDVVEACSGLRSLVSLLTLAVIYGYLFEQRVSRRVLLTLFAIPIAVITNGIRIMGSGIVAEFWNPANAEGFFHMFSGWLIFLLAFGLLVMFHWVVSWLDRRTPARHARCAV